jgi:hypothetical protein
VKCTRCEAAGPENVAAFPGTTWLCDKCAGTAHLVKDHILDLYKKGGAGKYLYVSDFTGNLDTVRNHILENVDLDTPNVIVLLTLPVGLQYLSDHIFDGVYLEQDSVIESDLKDVKIYDHGFIKIVDPSTQEVYDTEPVQN